MKKIFFISILLLPLLASLGHATVWFTCGYDDEDLRIFTEIFCKSYSKYDSIDQQETKFCPRIDSINGVEGDIINSFYGSLSKETGVISYTIILLEINNTGDFIYHSSTIGNIKVNEEKSNNHIDGYIVNKK